MHIRMVINTRYNYIALLQLRVITLTLALAVYFTQLWTNPDFSLHEIDYTSHISRQFYEL